MPLASETALFKYAAGGGVPYIHICPDALKKTIPKDGCYSITGEMGMTIQVSSSEGVVYLKSYHMPIRTAQSLQGVLNDYEYAKQTAAILAKLY